MLFWTPRMPANFTSGKFHADDADGNPLAGGLVYTYAAGTLTPLVTYTSYAATQENTNPVVLDERGEAFIWFSDAAYRVIVRTADDVTVYDSDNLNRDSAGRVAFDYSATYSAGTIGKWLQDLALAVGSTFIGWIQTGGSAILRTVRDKLRDAPPDIRDFGAVCDGVTDDYAAVAAAIASGAKIIKAPALTTRLSAGIVIPDGVTLEGESMLPENPPTGSVFLFDLSVPTCITLAGDNLDTAGLKNIAVRRATGTPPANATAVLVEKAYNIVIDNVMAHNHARGFSFIANTTEGLGAMVTNVYTGAITEDHFYIDSWPELRVNNGRLGMNGTGDALGNSFVKITGTSPSSIGIGPNGIIFSNVQMNQGVAGPAYWMDFEDVDEPVGNQVFYAMNEVHVENITDTYIRTAGSVTQPGRLKLNGVQLNTAVPMFDLDSATVINEWRIINSFIAASTFAPNIDTVNGLSVVANSFSGTAVTYDSGSVGSWQMSSVGNAYVASATQTIDGSRWTSGFFADTFNSGSTLTCTGTPRANLTIVSPLKSLTTWTPVLQFGGASTGITYSVQSGSCQVIGNMVFVQGRITLTNKGSATGPATIAGLPVAQNSGLFQNGSGGPLYGISNVSGFNGSETCSGALGTSGVLQLYQQGAASIASLQDTNFSNTSDFAFSATYSA